MRSGAFGATVVVAKGETNFQTFTISYIAELNRKTKKVPPKMSFFKSLTLMIQNKTRWKIFDLFIWPMCMTFPWAALCCHIKMWHQCVFSRSGIAVHFTQFARLKGHFPKKPFLVCHSHTPTQSIAPHWAPSDNVASIVPFLCRALCDSHN